MTLAFGHNIFGFINNRKLYVCGNSAGICGPTQNHCTITRPKEIQGYDDVTCFTFGLLLVTTKLDISL